MYGKIKFNKNSRDTIRYHEEKVAQGRAQCLYAGNFAKDLDQLTPSDKVYHFQRLTSLNDNIKKPIVHISLNFHSSEILSDQQMKAISREYMQKWKLPDQPYLVYRHTDSAAPHVHVISTVLRKDGSAERLRPRDFRQSRRLTQQLETAWSLTPSVRPSQWQKQPAGPARKIIYRQDPVYPGMRNIFDNVIDHYRYTSLEELNAILRLYNVEAYRGRPTSALYQHRGLIYRVLDDKGRAVGSAIKASSFDSKPTLRRLEQRFAQNQAPREAHRQSLTTAIDWAFYKKSLSFPAFLQAMAKEKVNIVLKKDTGGQPLNIWYVDHRHKTIFDGNTLGQRYTAGEITKRCVSEGTYQQQQQTQQQQQKVRLRLDHF